jgi:hypothetical protein
MTGIKSAIQSRWLVKDAKQWFAGIELSDRCCGNAWAGVAVITG